MLLSNLSFDPAAVWMVLSAFLYSLQNVDARFSGKVFGFWSVCVSRGLVGSWVCVVALLLSHWKKTDGKWWWLLARSVLGGATLLTSFFAISQCGLSTATVLTSTAPLWTVLNDYMMFSKNYKRSDFWIAMWCMGGLIVLLSGQHRGNHYYYMGVASAIVSAILQSAVNLTIRQLDKEDPAWVALWGMSGSMVLGMPGLVYETAHGQPSFDRASPLEWVSLLTTGVLSAAAQYCKTHSLQISHSMSVLYLRYTEVVFSVVWDIVLFQERFPWQTTTGILLLGTGCLAKLATDDKPPPSLLPTQCR